MPILPFIAAASILVSAPLSVAQTEKESTDTTAPQETREKKIKAIDPKIDPREEQNSSNDSSASMQDQEIPKKKSSSKNKKKNLSQTTLQKKSETPSRKEEENRERLEVDPD